MSTPELDALLNCDTCYGTLTINGVSMANPYGAWCLPDLSPLWGMPDQRPNADGLMPGATGMRGFPQRGTRTVYQLRFLASGQVNGQTGELVQDSGLTPEGMLATNIAYLYAQVLAPVGSGTGTRPAVWVVPDLGPTNHRVRATLPSGGVALLPSAVMRATMVLTDPYATLHL